jgi:hypothetical protein
VIEVGQEIHRPEQIPDGALFPMPKEFKESLVYRVLLGPEAADLPGLVQQSIVDLKICGHFHTIFHTLNVSITMPRAWRLFLIFCRQSLSEFPYVKAAVFRSRL